MYEFVIACIITWITVTFFDTFFKSCMFYPYYRFLEMFNITISPFIFKWHTTRWNRCITRWANNIKFIRLWFDVGVYVTAILFIPAITLLLVSCVKLLASQDKGVEVSDVLQPVIPGLNLPLSQIVYYLLTILVCSIIHELGHALAAARESVFISGFGIFVFVVLPAAFVDMPMEKLRCSSPRQQLRIFSAGIWHNFVLSFFAYLLLMVNPFLLTSGFKWGSGLTVLDVKSVSLSGPSGLAYGDIITHVDECFTADLYGWKSCLKDIASVPQFGYCATEKALNVSSISRELVSSPDCCENLSSNLCFEFVDKACEEGPRFSCMAVRKVVGYSIGRCLTSSDCNDGQCIRPVLDQHEKLFAIVRRNQLSVIFVGPPTEVFANVSLSPWSSRHYPIGVSVINMYETLLKYIISFSSALVLLNLIPCYGLDGQWLCHVYIDSLFSSSLKQSQRETLLTLLKAFGCLLLVSNIVLGLYRLVFI